MKKIVILVQGLPGSGKTTMSDMLAHILNAARVNADYVRQNISTDLGFSLEDRVEQARRMAHIAMLCLQGNTHTVIVDFVCPTEVTRNVFIRSLEDVSLYTVWMNTVAEGRYEDTNAIYEKPTDSTFILNRYLSLYCLQQYADQVATKIEAITNTRTYLIRYNTQCGTTDKRWRIIDAASGAETLVATFKTHGSNMRPWDSLEYGIVKYNVSIHATAVWGENHVDFY
jgi:adenylylsulfate kinase